MYIIYMHNLFLIKLIVIFFSFRFNPNIYMIKNVNSEIIIEFNRIYPHIFVIGIKIKYANAPVITETIKALTTTSLQ